MQIHIKCLECGKGTRNFELGKVFFFPEREDDFFLVRKPVICPKCKKDVSDRKFAVKVHELGPRLFAANLPIPFKSLLTPQIAGVKRMSRHRYEEVSKAHKGRPKIVKSFRKCD